jgi:hypothetical protein
MDRKNILLGHNEFGKEVVLNTESFLKPSRLLFQGISGSWKTETIKTIIKGLKEVTRTDQNPNGIQQIIFDWEGEYHPLRKNFPYILIGDEGEFPADVNIAEDLAIEVRKTGASVIVDLSSFNDYEQRQEFVGIFLRAIIDVGKQYWKPCVVIIDEAHNLCRQGESKSASKKPIIACVETGRKRGISTILVTQRLAALDKNATAQMVNRLIGLTVEVPDRVAAAKLLGEGQGVVDQIKDFDGGEYFAFGKALSSDREVQKFKVVQREMEKPDLLNVAPLNRYGQQVFDEIADRINFQTERAQTLTNPTTFVPDEEPNADSGFKDYDPDSVKKFLEKDKSINLTEKEFDEITKDRRSDNFADTLSEKGRVHLTQSELRKVKLEQWNKAFEYILQASETRKGILRRKIKLTDILKVKTRNGDEKYIITGMQDFCKKCRIMLEGNEKSICADCIREKTERRK